MQDHHLFNNTGIAVYVFMQLSSTWLIHYSVTHISSRFTMYLAQVCLCSPRGIDWLDYDTIFGKTKLLCFYMQVSDEANLQELCVAYLPSLVWLEKGLAIKTKDFCGPCHDMVLSILLGSSLFSSLVLEHTDNLVSINIPLLGCMRNGLELSTKPHLVLGGWFCG